MGKSKIIVVNTLLADAISGAFSEFQSLRDEMGDWAGNMEGANMLFKSASRERQGLRTCSRHAFRHSPIKPTN